MNMAAIGVALWFGLGPGLADVTQGCKGDCPEGYLSVCVERNDDCNCECSKDIKAGAEELAGLLRTAGVSTEGIERGLKKYRELAREAPDDFTFQLEDRGATYTVKVKKVNSKTLEENIVVTLTADQAVQKTSRCFRCSATDMCVTGETS